MIVTILLKRMILKEIKKAKSMSVQRSVGIVGRNKTKELSKNGGKNNQIPNPL